MAERSDREAIIDLTADYCWAIDTHDWDSLGDIFLADATADLGRELVGLDAIKERIRGALEPLDASQHLIGSHQVRVDGDRATCRCNLQAQHLVGEGSFLLGGRYEDRLVRTDGGWRIEHRDLVRLWTTGDPSIMRR